jgi:hypothetical protein
MTGSLGCGVEVAAAAMRHRDGVVGMCWFACRIEGGIGHGSWAGSIPVDPPFDPPPRSPGDLRKRVSIPVSRVSPCTGS